MMGLVSGSWHRLAAWDDVEEVDLRQEMRLLALVRVLKVETRLHARNVRAVHALPVWGVVVSLWAPNG